MLCSETVDPVKIGYLTNVFGINYKYEKFSQNVLKNVAIVFIPIPSSEMTITLFCSS